MIHAAVFEQKRQHDRKRPCTQF